jgi:hypothetical protein
VPVQLEVGDVVEEAIGGKHAVLVVAAEERDLDLLAFVLVGVVLDTSETSRVPLSSNAVPAVEVARCAARVVSVWSRNQLRTAGRSVYGGLSFAKGLSRAEASRASV